MKAQLRNDIATARIRSDVPTARADFGAILAPGTDTEILAGTPIGLLLVLTYATAFTGSTEATFKGFSPTAGIRNTD